MQKVINFQSFNLVPVLLQAVTKMGYTVPTPIQAKAIPAGIDGKDILGCAQTGTGKTAAFLVPILNRLLNQKEAGCTLILVPTRELAAQIHEVLAGLTQFSKHLSSAILIGGTSMQPQMRALQKRPRVIIATPGRLQDHVNRRTVDLKRFDVLVLDEADRMLDMGFLPQIKLILKGLPERRQSFLFTATLPEPMKKLARTLLKNPVEITIGQVSKPIERIEQEMLPTTSKDKATVLVSELKNRKGSVIVFVRTKHRADRLFKTLLGQNQKVGIIHGGKSQSQRNTALQSFRDSVTRILVATDVVARGLDIPQVEHVINYDMPRDAEDYVHRIGRTGRAGKSGAALSLVMPEERQLWDKICKL